jgi:hypothetical protein
MDTQTKTPKSTDETPPPEELTPTPDEPTTGGSSQSTAGDVADPPASPENDGGGETDAEPERPKNQPRPYVVFEKTGEDTFKLLRTGVLALRPEVAIESCIAGDATGSYAAVTERSWHVLSTETETVTKRKWA